MDKNLEINSLFDKRINKFEFKTTRFGLVDYVNLDNAATTPPFLSVENEVRDYLTSYGSVHRGSGEKSKVSTDIYENCRGVIKSFVSAPTNSYILFSSNTTGAINMAAYFFSFLRGKVAVSSIEHSSSFLPWVKSEGMKKLGSEQYELNDLENVNERIQLLGRNQVLNYEINEKFEFDLDNIESILQKNEVKVFVLTASSNVTGYCPEVKKIGELVHKYGAYFLVDACQYLPHHKIDMKEMCIDFLVASGHKIYAPYGAGFLIGPKDFLDKFLPYQIGGGNLPYITESGEFIIYHNQLTHDPGTPNAVGVVAMTTALQQIFELGIENIENYEKKLTKRLYDYLSSNYKVELFVSKEHLSTIIPFRIKDKDSKEIAEKLNTDYGIGVRVGSFCVYSFLRKLLGIRDENDIVKSVKSGEINKIPSLLRASIGLCNTETDIDRIILAIKELTNQ